jgi:hypothetical protein
MDSEADDRISQLWRNAMSNRNSYRLDVWRDERGIVNVDAAQEAIRLMEELIETTKYVDFLDRQRELRESDQDQIPW